MADKLPRKPQKLSGPGKASRAKYWRTTRPIRGGGFTHGGVGGRWPTLAVMGLYTVGPAPYGGGSYPPLGGYLCPEPSPPEENHPLYEVHFGVTFNHFYYISVL